MEILKCFVYNQHLGKHKTAKGKHWKIINGTRVWYTEVKNVDK